jgi:hypothetical protein
VAGNRASGAQYSRIDSACQLRIDDMALNVIFSLTIVLGYATLRAVLHPSLDGAVAARFLQDLQTVLLVPGPLLA